MVGIHHLLLFIVSGLLLNLTPGQDTLFIVGRTVSQGRRAGLLSVLGISSGSVVHTLAAAFGLSAILATSAMAFTIVKLAGAAYLVYLGVSMLIDARPSVPPRSLTAQPQIAETAAGSAYASDVEVYRSGLVTNILNPKVALFFMAFLPQFVDPARGSRILSFLLLGAIFIFNGTLWCLVLVWGAATMSRRLREHASAGVLLKRATGALFVGLGARLAVSR